MMNTELYNYLVNYGQDISELYGSLIQRCEDYPTYYWALDKEHSLVFTSLCAEELIPIIGGDIIAVLSDGLELTYTNWHYDRVGNECFKDYVSHSIDKAREYLSYYDNKESVLFSFTTLDHVCPIKVPDGL